MPVLVRRYDAFAGLFTAAKELKRTLSFEAELDIGSLCGLREDIVMSAQLQSRIGDAFSVWRPLGPPTFRNLLIFRDTEDSNRCLEMFPVNSWGEHLRQHERVTKADRELEERIRSYTLKEPTVRHLIYAAPH